MVQLASAQASTGRSLCTSSPRLCADSPPAFLLDLLHITLSFIGAVFKYHPGYPTWTSKRYMKFIVKGQHERTIKSCG